MVITRALILGTLLASIGLCASITEVEVNGASSNNTIGTAQAIPTSAFTSGAPASVFNTSQNSVTVQGHGGAQDVDFYSFTAGGPLQIGITESTFTFPTILSLFDSTGHLLAFNASSDPVRSGSQASDDSYLGTYVLPSIGTYYVAVSNLGASIPNFPDTSSCTGFGANALTRPDGAATGGFTTSGCDTTSSVFAFAGAQPATNSLAYTLVIAQTPEPGTLSLMLFGLGMAAAIWRKRTQQAR